MAPRSSSLAEVLTRRFKTLEVTRDQIEELAGKGQLSRHATSRMYEALFLSAHVAVEAFLEELFIGLLIDGGGVTSDRNDVQARVVIRSHRIARELITGPGRKYVDWIPYDRTMDLAKLYFRGGRPFTDLSPASKQVLARSHVIRNAVAHRSRYSMSQFEKHVIGNTPLPPRERTPAGYLRGLFRASPAQTRFSNLLAQLAAVSRELAH